jgi:eukaryotic-like serine/threonine-protein kinase
MVEGIQSIHRAGIIHSDIKAANFMVEEKPNHQYTAYVIDLGSGIQIGNESDTKDIKAREGSLCFSSPEVVKEEQSYIESDIWSLGCVLYFMATKCNPWKKETRLNPLVGTMANI